MSRNILLTALLCMLCLSSAGLAASVGFSITNSTPMAAEDLAGAPGVRVGNWNSWTGTSIGAEAPFQGDIIDDSGAVTGMTATITDGGRFNNYFTGGNDLTLFGQAADVFPGSGGSPRTVTVSNIPYSKYDVYCYMKDDSNGSTANRAGSFAIGEVKYYIQGLVNDDGWPAADGTGYILSEDTTYGTGDDIDQGNYCVFKGITGETFELIVASEWGSDGRPRNKFAGFQIVASGVDHRAKDPMPANQKSDVVRDADLSWTPDSYAVSHDVYVGTSFDDVNDATPASAEFMGNQTETTYELARLAFNETPFWRVDEVNGAPDNTVHKGAVWSFEVEPEAIALDSASITVTASSAPVAAWSPEKTLDGSGLDPNGTHGTDSDTMWASDEEPNGAWIQYSFDQAYLLHEMQVWNYNSIYEQYNGGNSIKDVNVYTSLNGVDWTLVAGINQFSQGPGQEGYSGEVFSLAGVVAQYLRIEAISNWNAYGIQRFGLSEVAFSVIPTAVREMSPADGAAGVDPNMAILSWRAGRLADHHELYFDTDEEAVIDGSAGRVIANDINYPPVLDFGATYYWRVDEVNDAEDPAVWTGAVQSFSTKPSILVDGMETYKAVDGFKPWQTWVDGLEMGGSNGSIVGTDDEDVETTIVHGGSKSLPFTYGNKGKSNSWATRQIDADWSINGISSLQLYFYGDVNNTPGQLYVKVNNSRFDYEGAATDLQMEQWIPFNLDLGSITQVDELTLGVEGEAGTILIDDIYLFPQASELITPVTPGSDALLADFAFNGDASDISGNGIASAIVGEPNTVDGPHGSQALSFDGTGNEYIDLGTWNPTAEANELTVSLWLNWDGTSGQYQGILGKRSSWSGADMMWDMEANKSNGVIRWGRNGSTVGSGQAPIVGQWEHWAVTTDGAIASIYRNGFLLASGNFTYGTNADASMQIGCGEKEGGNPFNGALSDVRLYNEVLSDAEIAGLAGRTEPLYSSF